jgi:hypothetical protein
MCLLILTLYIFFQFEGTSSSLSAPSLDFFNQNTVTYQEQFGNKNIYDPLVSNETLQGQEYDDGYLDPLNW